MNFEKIRMGIAMMLHTTNTKYQKYEGRKGILYKIVTDNGYMYNLDMIRYWHKTSLIEKVHFEASTLTSSKMVATTLNSVYTYQLYLNQTELTPEEIEQSIADLPPQKTYQWQKNNGRLP